MPSAGEDYYVDSLSTQNGASVSLPSVPAAVPAAGGDDAQRQLVMQGLHAPPGLRHLVQESGERRRRRVVRQYQRDEAVEFTETEAE
jgi:hypothetical protein